MTDLSTRAADLDAADPLRPLVDRFVPAPGVRAYLDGNSLGRPLADTLQGSRIVNLKELRPLGGSIRILFVFDPRRVAILLLGGDKAGQWQQWYRDMIPLAERLYEIYLAELRREGLLEGG